MTTHWRHTIPTNAHRVQVLLSPDLLDVVKNLSDEKGISMGKTVALLCREACLSRGLLQQGDELGQPTHKVEVVAQKTDHSDLTPEDMKLLKMLKLFKEMS